MLNDRVQLTIVARPAAASFTLGEKSSPTEEKKCIIQYIKLNLVLHGSVLEKMIYKGEKNTYIKK